MGAGMTLKRSGWLVPAPDSVVANSIRCGKPAWADGIHVLWSVWVFITPMFAPNGYTMYWVLLTLVSYPLFLFMFTRAMIGPSRYVNRHALGLIAMSVLLLPWYPSGMSYFVFGCTLLRPRRANTLPRYLALLVSLGVGFMLYGMLLGYPWRAIVWMPVVSVIVGVVIHVENANQRRDHAIKLSHEEVRRLASSAERERIGRDLHDLLGHTLSLVALKADLAGKLIERDPAAARREIGELSGVAREALSQVRRAVSGIRAAGIAAELASAKLLLETDGVAFNYNLDDAVSNAVLPPGVETVLALTVREAVTNIQRHAQATQADVSFAVEGGEAVLRISDDGRGGAIVPGNGLSGMRERLEAAHGRLHVDAARGKGVRLEARLPLAANDDVAHDLPL